MIVIKNRKGFFKKKEREGLIFILPAVLILGAVSLCFSLSIALFNLDVFLQLELGNKNGFY